MPLAHGCVVDGSSVAPGHQMTGESSLILLRNEPLRLVDVLTREEPVALLVQVLSGCLVHHVQVLFVDEHGLQVLPLFPATRQKSDGTLPKRFLHRPEIPPKEISKSIAKRPI